MLRTVAENGEWWDHPENPTEIVGIAWFCGFDPAVEQNPRGRMSHASRRAEWYRLRSARRDSNRF